MGLTDDLKSIRWIYAKGLLFLFLAMIASGMLVARDPSWKTGCLLAISIWASCRAYYFAFYVIEHYVDAGFRFSGLFDFAKYLFGRKR